jgi:hypothetical protein
MNGRNLNPFVNLLEAVEIQERHIKLQHAETKYKIQEARIECFLSDILILYVDIH